MINFPLKMTLLFALLFPILMKLGIWQLDLYEHKSYSHNEKKSSQSFPVLSMEQLTDLKIETLHNTSINISGKFQNNICFLFDNQILKGQDGFYVLMPFVTDKNHTFIVNRGFIPRPQNGSVPYIPTFEQTTSISGLLYHPQECSFFSKKDHWIDGWPKIIQSIDFKKIKQLVNAQFPNIILQLSDDHPASLSNKKTLLGTYSSKHLCYAIIWFSMALFLLFIYINQIIRLRKKQYESYL